LKNRRDARVVLLVAQAGDDLAPDALDRVRVEARLGQRQGEERDALVGVLDQHLERAADRVGAGMEGQFDRPGGQPLLEGVGGEVARALVEEPGQHLSAAGLAGGILGGTALEREGQRDHRHHGGFDVPRLDARGGRHRQGRGGRAGGGGGVDQVLGDAHGNLIVLSCHGRRRSKLSS